MKRFEIEVNPHIPPRLERLQELAGNLWFSWDRPTRALFARLSPGLWSAVHHSPKAFLKRIDQQRLDEAAEDPVFLGTMKRVLAAYDAYHNNPEVAQRNGSELAADDLIAYFCAEFGFHESLPIYSGGLGILAGDHCKGASDLRLPFVGVGLLYRQGYFRQTIDREGRQHALFSANDFEDMPIEPVRAADGHELHVHVELPGRTVHARLWRAQVGNVSLVLLDSDIDDNSPGDRNITHQLYGGDRRMRLEQEILLGVGGVRALRLLGLQPTVWHINEGHAAFMVIERIRDFVTQGADFATATEATAANTVFTTHTPVPAGHDYFDPAMIRDYLGGFAAELGVPVDTLVALGHSGGRHDFNMTALAVRGSRFQNGVSRIHGSVSARICADLWPQIDPAENPLDHVTNAVHVPTFLATDWYETFDRFLGLGWQHRLTEQECWNRVHEIPDQIFWSVRQSLKAQLLFMVRNRIRAQVLRNQGSEAHIDRLLRLADPANPNILTVGFARRFATYKRATLLFRDLDWLREIIGDSQRPVLFLFAGKAHPADEPGQQLIREISRLTQERGLEGQVLLLEDYDLHVARRLTAGVDVWLNTPLYPLEASGTSGMKAAINGTLNLSVLDGWWGEGYDGRNGWAIKPASECETPEQRDQEEARTLYELLQDSVVPMYYRNAAAGYSPEWVAMAKQSIASILPRFNMNRMLGEYTAKFYQPAARQWRRHAADGLAGARTLAAWKARVAEAWTGVAVRDIVRPQARVRYGEALRFEVAVRLNGLSPEDVTVELVFSRPGVDPLHRRRSFILLPAQALDGGEHLYALELTPEQCGKLEYRIRAYPCHALLTHRFEMGRTLWL